MQNINQRRLCAHADDDGRGMHYLEPGERCPDASRTEPTHHQKGTTMHTTETMSSTEIRNLFRFSPPTTVECPTWCDLPAGHGYDSEDAADGGSVRHHVIRFVESTAVTIEASGTWRDGVEVLGEPHICVWVDTTKADDMLPDAASARQVAAALLEAAKVLEELQSR